jgi:N-acetyl-alpha-D-muramate 1-phosphate uridylyltransferase
VNARIEQVPAALLAGGLATRLRPITETLPKALVEVAGRPFVEHQLALLHRNGIRRVVLCLGHLGEQIEQHLGDGAAYGMQLGYSYDGERQLGTGGALRRALPQLGETFWVLYGDSYLDIDYRAVLAAFERSDALGLMTVLRNGNRWDRSNVIFRDGELLRYDKRAQTPEMEYIDYGAALLTRAALERIPEDTPYDLADLYAALVAERRMAGYEVTQRFYEIGSHAGLDETRAYLGTSWGHEVD